MKRHEIPLALYERAKEKGLTSTIWLGRAYYTNPKQVEELLQKLKNFEDWWTDNFKLFHEFPEGIRVDGNYSNLRVGYDEHENQLVIYLPERSELYNAILDDPLPYEWEADEKILPTNRVEQYHIGILIDRLVRELQRWKDYLDEEIGE